MLLDLQNLLSDSQAPTTGTTVSTNAIDLGSPDTVAAGFKARGSGVHDLPSRYTHILVQVDTTCTSGGSSTVQAQLISSASANLGTPTVIQSSAAIPVATLVAGYQFRLEIPPGITQRYLGVQYVVAVADLTAGSFTAGIADAIQSTHPNG